MSADGETNLSKKYYDVPKGYIEANIKALKCKRFVQKEDKDKCFCGRMRIDHEYRKDTPGKWDKDQDLEQITTDAYGKMKFAVFPVFRAHQKYVRASSTDTLCTNLYHIMTEIWHIPKPELIISIHGGAKKMISLNAEQKSAFKRGLMNISQEASTWIITDGFNFGVSKLVGEAAKDYNVASLEKSFTVLGIGTWGAVHNRQNLVLKGGYENVPYNNAVSKFSLEGQAPLDPNHDAFILFDSGIEGQFAMELEFRTQFEDLISKEAKCCTVQLIVGGDITAIEALKCDIPVVIIKGSEADVKLKLDIHNECLQKNKKEGSITTDTDDLESHGSLYDFKQKNLIHIFSMSDFNKTLDMAIFEAAVSGKLTDDEKLKFAMTFNRPDVIEESIPSRTDYGEFIEIALIKNQWKFVKLFLSRGTQIESFLTKCFLEELYFNEESTKYTNPNILLFLKENVGSSYIDDMSTIGLIIQKLTQNLIMDMYTVNQKCTGCNSSTSVGQKSEYDVIYTELDLFIWALLTQRWEMAKIFWEFSKDHIGSALIASVMCNSLRKIASKEGDMDLKSTLRDFHEEYEMLALRVLTEAYDRDKIRTHLLLIRALPYWCGVTCMEIANKGQLINFLSHLACQNSLDSIWLGGMSIYTSTTMFLFNVPLAFLTSKLLIFRRRYDKRTPKVSSTETITPCKKNEYLPKFRSKQQIAWRTVTFCHAVSMFYRAPQTKFTMHVISYLLFLAIFSYMLLVELLPLKKVTVSSERKMEYVVYVYILSFCLEDARQSIAGTQIGTLTERVVDWISCFWNIYDLFLYILFLIAVIMRSIHSITFHYTRTVFSVTLSLFYLRFLQFYYANKSLGPKVILVSRMIKDIAFFLALYVFAIVAYGTFAQALLFHNSPLNFKLFENIVKMPYWQSYGDLNLDYFKGNDSDNGVTKTPNPAVPFAFAIYMLFTNALLMNMLVAMFGRSFEKVKENANRIWAFHRYKLIEEFYYRPILPPPLNAFEIMWMVFRYCSCKPFYQKFLKKNDFIVNLSQEEHLRSAEFERQCLEMILYNPFLKDQGKQSFSIAVPRESMESEANILTQKWMTSVVENFAEMKHELKVVKESVHKLGRQKIARSNSIV